MARINKFASVNLNDLFGKKEPAVKTAVNSSGSGARPKGASHGMLVLTYPMKQPVRIGSGTTGTLKKEVNESSTPIGNNNSGWSNTSQIDSENGCIIKDNSEPLYPINEPKSYIPPSLRESHSTSVSSVSVKLEPVTVGKATVLHGDEYPSLKASLSLANRNGQQHQTKELQQKQKDNRFNENEQLGKLQQLSIQAHSKSSLNVANEPDMNRFQPQRPRFFRPPHLRGDQLAKPEMVTERPDRSLSRDSYLMGDNNSSDWADDERANGFRVRPGSANSDKRPGSANSDKRPGSGGYSDRIYRSDDFRKENPTYGTIHPLESAQSDYVVIMKEGRAGLESLWDNKAMFPPSRGGMYEREVLSRHGSGGARYCEREALPHPESGGSRYEREVLPRPGSGESRYEREVLVRPGSGESRYEKEALPRPGSGGSRYEKEALPRPGSGGSRYEREALPRPRSGGSRFDQEAFPQPISSGNRYEREVMPQSDSGGCRYEREAFLRSGSGDSRSAQESLPRPVSGGKYEREVLPHPGSGGSRYEREVFQRSGSGGSRFEQESLARPVSGGSRYRKETLAFPSLSRGMNDRQGSSCPGSGGGMHEREVTSLSGYGGESYGSEVVPCLGSNRYSCDREVNSQPNSGGDNYSRPGSGGSRYGREELSSPGTVGVCYPQQGFNGGSDYMQPNSGRRSYEREVVSRPGSGGSRNDRTGSGGDGRSMIPPGIGINGQIDGGELYKDSSFNGKQNYQRRVTNPSRGHSDGHYRAQNGNIYHAQKSNREKGPVQDNWLKPGGI